MKPTTPARVYKTKLRAGCEKKIREINKSVDIYLSELRTTYVVMRESS